mgnify:FL=1
MRWVDWLAVTLGLLAAFLVALCLSSSAVVSKLQGLKSMLPAFPSLPKWPSWRLSEMLSGSPLIWLCVVLGLALPATYGVLKVKSTWEVRAAYDKGVDAGKGQASVATVDAAKKTADAIRQADEEVFIRADRKAVYERCKRAASCRERGLP